jgi:dihydrofolate reductase
MLISMIVCLARNRTIGRDGGMPWRMPSDLKFFRSVTLGKPVVMGRKTFQSIGRALDGRTNYVITRQMDLPLAGCVIAGSLADALAAATATGATEVMILGGGEIFAQALPMADRIYVTELQADIAGDTVFPELDAADWKATARTLLATGPKDDYPAHSIIYERRR